MPQRRTITSADPQSAWGQASGIEDATPSWFQSVGHALSGGDNPGPVDILMAAAPMMPESAMKGLASKLLDEGVSESRYGELMKKFGGTFNEDNLGRTFTANPSKATSEFPELRLTSYDPEKNVTTFHDTDTGTPYASTMSDAYNAMQKGDLQPSGPQPLSLQSMIDKVLSMVKGK